MGLKTLQTNNYTISVEEFYNSEMNKSERYRALILVGLLALEAVALVIIYFFYSKEYLQMFKTHIAIYAILIFTFIIIVYEFIVHFLSSRRKKQPFVNSLFFSYFNSFSEVTLLSILLIFIVQYSNQPIILQAPATLTYFIFIVLSTFRLNFKLSFFTGFISAVEFILISIYYSTLFQKTELIASPMNLTGMQYLGQGLIMIITGIASGFVADLIKKKMLLSWSNIFEKNEVIDLFGQQISQQIANSILENKNELSGARKKVCIMFLDIREFTHYVEQHPPEEVVSYLNKLFGFMINSIESHHGVINQFLGDGFMATFGAPVSVGNSSQLATDAALEIMNKLNTEFEQGKIPKTSIGIGLHFDEAVTGNIGSSIRKQYSITGKVVIIASRIEQLNKEFKTSLIISESVYNQLTVQMRASFKWLGYSRIKGSEKMISLYTPLQEKNQEHPKQLEL